MLDTVRILSNVASVNIFDVVSEAKVFTDNGLNLYFKLYQSDRKERYTPATGSTMTVKFLRAKTVAQTPVDQSLTVAATIPFATDPSIWLVTLTALQVASIVSGGIQVTLVEPSATTVIFVPSVITKVPTSGGN